MEGTIGGSAASASDHLHLGPGRGLRRRGIRVRARGGRGWGSGLGLPASHTTHARNTWEHLSPQSTYMHPCVNTYTQLGHTCTHLCPLGPIVLTHSLQGHTSSHACPHGNGGGQKQAGWGRAEEGAALPQAVWQKLTQASSLLMLRPPPGPLAWLQGHRPHMEEALTTCQAQC